MLSNITMSICVSEVLLNMDNDFNNRISDRYELFSRAFQDYFWFVSTNKQHTRLGVLQ